MTGPASRDSWCPVRLAHAEAYWLQASRPAVREAELADDVRAGGGAWNRGRPLPGCGAPARPGPRGDLAQPYRLRAAGDWEHAARLWTGPGLPVRGDACPVRRVSERGAARGPKAFTGPGASAAAQITGTRLRLLGIRSTPRPASTHAA